MKFWFKQTGPTGYIDYIYFKFKNLEEKEECIQCFKENLKSQLDEIDEPPVEWVKQEFVDAEEDFNRQKDYMQELTRIYLKGM